jgi:hypothetical protein
VLVHPAGNRDQHELKGIEHSRHLSPDCRSLNDRS